MGGRDHPAWGRKSKLRARYLLLLASDTDQMLCQSSEVWQRYHDAVTAACDSAMQPEPPTWRYPYYVITLKAMTAASLEIDNSKRRNSWSTMQWQGTCGVSEATQSTMMDSLPQPSSQADNEDSICSPCPTAKSDPLIISPLTHTPSSVLTSPTTICRDHSPTLVSPLSTTDDINCVQCECGKPFTGKFRVPNLQRHKSFAEIHNKEKIRCEKPECYKMIGRPDNMRKHLRTVHKLSLPPDQRRNSNRKRRRSPNERQETVL